VEYCDLRGCGNGSTGASSGCLEDDENGAERTHNVAIGEEERSSLFSPAGVRQCARSLLQDAGITNHNDDDDNDDMMQGRPCHLLLSRARSNPVLSLAATFLIGLLYHLPSHL